MDNSSVRVEVVLERIHFNYGRLSRAGVLHVRTRLGLAALLIGLLLVGSPVAAVEPGARRVLEDLPTLVRVKRDAPIAWPLELFVGARIEVRNGCVHLANGGALAIWPPHYELLIVDGRAVGVLDPEDGSSLRFGDSANLGGGDTRIANQYLDPAIPPACAGRTVQVYLGS